MKLVKNLVFASLLVFAITVNTLAGEQQMPNATQPPPPPTGDQVLAYPDGTTTLGGSDTGEITAETTDYLFFEALAALLSVY
jgi:hypothetical protein